jgi:hypothetical protein
VPGNVVLVELVPLERQDAPHVVTLVEYASVTTERSIFLEVRRWYGAAEQSRAHRLTQAGVPPALQNSRKLRKLFYDMAVNGNPVNFS